MLDISFRDRLYFVAVANSKKSLQHTKLFMPQQVSKVFGRCNNNDYMCIIASAITNHSGIRGNWI